MPKNSPEQPGWTWNPKKAIQNLCTARAAKRDVGPRPDLSGMTRRSMIVLSTEAAAAALVAASAVGAVMYAVDESDKQDAREREKRRRAERDQRLEVIDTRENLRKYWDMTLEAHVHDPDMDPADGAAMRRILQFFRDNVSPRDHDSPQGGPTSFIIKALASEADPKASSKIAWAINQQHPTFDVKTRTLYLPPLELKCDCDNEPAIDNETPNYTARVNGNSYDIWPALRLMKDMLERTNFERMDWEREATHVEKIAKVRFFDDYSDFAENSYDRLTEDALAKGKSHISPYDLLFVFNQILEDMESQFEGSSPLHVKLRLIYRIAYYAYIEAMHGDFWTGDAKEVMINSLKKILTDLRWISAATLKTAQRRLAKSQEKTDVEE